jgi:hypothetical protein
MTDPPHTQPPGGPPGQYGAPFGAPPFPNHYGQSGYYGQQGYQPTPSKAMAGWALGLSIFNCLGVGALIAIGLGIAVLVKGQRDGRNHGAGMAIAALIISALWIVGLVVFLVLAFLGKIEIDDSDRDQAGRITHEQEISLSSLREGDCLAEEEFDMSSDEGEDIYEVTAAPCSGAHSLEAYVSFDLDDGDYPGDDEVVRLANIGCINRFGDFVGVPPARSRLVVTFIYPQSSSWRIQDDREVLCFVGEADGSTVGTLEGSKR